MCACGACRYRSEVQRLRNVFRSAVAADVARLKEAVGEYKENTSRLECQKQLLLKQVTHNRLALCLCPPSLSPPPPTPTPLAMQALRPCPPSLSPHLLPQSPLPCRLCRVNGEKNFYSTGQPQQTMQITLFVVTFSIGKTTTGTSNYLADWRSLHTEIHHSSDFGWQVQ